GRRRARLGLVRRAETDVVGVHARSQLVERALETAQAILRVNRGFRAAHESDSTVSELGQVLPYRAPRLEISATRHEAKVFGLVRADEGHRNLGLARRRQQVTLAPG